MKLKLLYKDIQYQNLISEGVYDKNIFKAIFLAGSTGSGKSFVNKSILQGHGLKDINSDIPLTHLMNKSGLSLKMPDSEKDKRNQLRQVAKKLTLSKEQNHIHNRLGIIIDGTAKDYNAIVKKSNELRDLGYDTFMVFVFTSLDIAKERNRSRGRSLPDNELEKIYNQTTTNLTKYQTYFGNNFRMVKNEEKISSNNPTLTNANFKEVDKIIRKFINTPIKNPIAKQWIDDELKSRNITL